MCSSPASSPSQLHFRPKRRITAGTTNTKTQSFPTKLTTYLANESTKRQKRPSFRHACSVFYFSHPPLAPKPRTDRSALDACFARRLPFFARTKPFRQKTSPPQGDITPRRGNFSSTCAGSSYDRAQHCAETVREAPASNEKESDMAEQRAASAEGCPHQIESHAGRQKGGEVVAEKGTDLETTGRCQ